MFPFILFFFVFYCNFAVPLAIYNFCLLPCHIMFSVTLYSFIFISFSLFRHKCTYLLCALCPHVVHHFLAYCIGLLFALMPRLYVVHSCFIPYRFIAVNVCVNSICYTSGTWNSLPATRAKCKKRKWKRSWRARQWESERERKVC